MSGVFCGHACPQKLGAVYARQSAFFTSSRTLVSGNAHAHLSAPSTSDNSADSNSRANSPALPLRAGVAQEARVQFIRNKVKNRTMWK